MSVIQLSAGSGDNEKERQPLVAVPAAKSGQGTVNLIIPTPNELITWRPFCLGRTWSTSW
jgi:hypothetical protein